MPYSTMMAVAAQRRIDATILLENETAVDLRREPPQLQPAISGLPEGGPAGGHGGMGVA